MSDRPDLEETNIDCVIVVSTALDSKGRAIYAAELSSEHKRTVAYSSSAEAAFAEVMRRLVANKLSG